MKLLGEDFDFSGILGYFEGACPDFKSILNSLAKEGYDRVIGRTNQYGYPKYQWALMPEDPVPQAYMTKPRSFVLDLKT